MSGPPARRNITVNMPRETDLQLLERQEPFPEWAAEVGFDPAPECGTVVQNTERTRESAARRLKPSA